MESEERSVPYIPLANTTPALSFYQFMRRQRNDITPEEARNRFETSSYLACFTEGNWRVTSVW